MWRRALWGSKLLDLFPLLSRKLLLKIKVSTLKVGSVSFPKTRSSFGLFEILKSHVDVQNSKQSHSGPAEALLGGDSRLLPLKGSLTSHSQYTPHTKLSEEGRPYDKKPSRCLSSQEYFLEAGSWRPIILLCSILSARQPGPLQTFHLL